MTRIKIELLSDLCCYSGEVYNTTVDTDVVYDSYGIPYIPAKRIKGCIREAALELMEFGLFLSYEDIFGKEGDQESIFTLSNAKIENYKNVVNAIEFHKDKGSDWKRIIEPQKVLQQYTYIRTQTSIDSKTGSAKENSLRTLRVVKKGTVFYADLDFKGNDAQFKEFKDAVATVKHMGVSRTRGLGLVNLTVEEAKEQNVKHVLFNTNELFAHNEIEYTIKLESPIICKSSEGNQAKSEDYIAGSKILGVIAGRMGKDTYRSIMNDITVSNAYITYNNNRTKPGRNSWQKEKNKKYDNNGEMALVDMMYFVNNPEKKQWSPVNIKYISEDNHVKSVETEISYHHQRPTDKSIGKALENTNDKSKGAFYQLGSICGGQVFKGYIRANKEVAEKVIDSISKLGNVRIGYGKNSEFGQVQFTLDSVKEIKYKNETIKEADLLLVSDLILYNENGMLVADIDALEKFLRKKFNCDDITIENPFLSYSTIGGYNVTWKSRKPIFAALSKGSVMQIKSVKGFDASYNHHYFIGERTSEGYGEVVLEKTSQQDKPVYKKAEVVAEINGEKDTAIIEQLLMRECLKKADELIRDKVNELNSVDNAALSKIRLLFRTKETYAEMYAQCEQLNSSNKEKCLALLKAMPVYLKDDKKDVLDIATKEIRKKYDKNFELRFKETNLEKAKYKYIYNAYITELKNKMKKEETNHE